MAALLSTEHIQLLSAAALALSLLIYVMLDGADLGVGMIYALNPQSEHRHIMTLSLLPIWDGNETWLVLSAGGLLTLFPAAYSIMLSALYVPLMGMLLMLVLRGMAIEYREHTQPHRRPLLDVTLSLSSALAALCQGVMMGAYIQGIPQDGARYTGSGWEWFSPFPLLCGVALMAGYGLLGVCWLIWRTEGALQKRARHQARWLGPLALLLLSALLALTCFQDESYRRHLLNGWIGITLGIGMLSVAAGFWLSLRASVDMLPLCLALAGVILAFSGLLLTTYPSIIPPHLSIAQAASPPLTQGFLLAGFALLVPITLAYNTFAFWVFHGKIHGKSRHGHPPSA